MEKTEAWIVGLLVVSVLLSVAGIAVLGSKSVPVYSSTSKMTGFATGYVNGTLESMVAYELDPIRVDFGNLTLGQTDSTEDNSPKPFGFNNTGTVKINMTMSGTVLFTGTNPVFKFKSNCTTASCGTTGFAASYLDVNATAQNVLTKWEFNTTMDKANVHINITVPVDEPAGAKVSTITFTGTQA